MYFGATISGETYGEEDHAPRNSGAWNLFERHAGRKVAILNQGQGWATFDKAAMDATHARGAIPHVTMGLPGGVTLAEVAAGDQDAAIRSWARAARAWGHPFLFAPWWEMNGTWYSWGRSPDFIEAWRHFHEIVAEEGATNVTWTWVVNSLWSDPLSDPTPYYPGDAYVDWVGLDSYNWGLNPVQPDRWISPEQTLTPTVERLQAIAPQKPVVVVENASSEYGGNKGDWIREMLTTYLPHHPEIKAYLWFNWNFPKEGNPDGERFDWPIETSAPSQQQFRKGIQSSVFVPGPVSLPSLTKVPPPAPASADPAQPADLSAAAEMADGADVAVAPDGTATVVWSARPPGDPDAELAILARRIGPDGSRGPVHQLSASGEDALAPQVAVAPDGAATVAWARAEDPDGSAGPEGTDFRVQARRIAPDGTPEEATRTLSGAEQDALAPQVAVAPDGEATVVWKRFNGTHYLVQGRRIAPDGTSEEPSQLLSAAGKNAAEPQVAVAPDGTATVVWSRFDGSDSVVQGRRVGPTGTLEPVENLSAGGESAVQPRVAVDAEGEATVVWIRFDGSDWIVQSRRLSAAGVPAGVQDLSSGGESAAEPQLAVGADGTATVVWDRWDGDAFVVQARRLDPAGIAIGAPVSLSGPGQDAADPQLAIAPDGTATVLWSRFDGSGWVVQRRDLRGDGSLGSVESLSAPGRDAGDPALAWSEEGILAMTWRRFGGAGDVVQSNTVPKPPPPPPPPVVPGAGTGTGTAPSGPPQLQPPRFSNLFQLGRPRLNRKRGTATVAVALPGPGQLTLRGAVPRRRQVSDAGAVTLRIVPRAGQRRALLRRGALRLRLTVAFEPLGGEPSSRKLGLRLVLASERGHRRDH